MTRSLLTIAMLIPAAATDAAPDGAALYAEHCSACHGANLEGEPNWRTQKDDGTLPAPPHDDSGHTWHHPDRMLWDYVKLGGAETLRRMGVSGFESAMPAFGGIMSEAEIEAVLDFIKSSWSPAMRDHQQMIMETSE